MSATAWQPGHTVTSDTPLSALLNCIGVSGEGESYSLIGKKLEARNCKTVGDLEQWTYGELKQLLVALALPKNFRAYISAIASATCLTFEDIKEEVSAGQGAEWSTRCTKKAISSAFIPHSYTPDGRCYAHLPKKGAALYLDTEQEQLYVDLVWLEAQVHPEEALGEYLPAGMDKRFRKLHDENFPPFKPHNLGKRTERSRDAARALRDRFQNARNGNTYKRMVVDDKFKHVFVGKVATSVVFVPSDSELLLDNKRNEYLALFLKLHKGEVQVRAILDT